jgi:hypothetical protein
MSPTALDVPEEMLSLRDHIDIAAALGERERARDPGA